MEQTPSSPGHSPELPSVSPPSNREVGGAFSNHEVVGEGFAERHEQRPTMAPRAEQVAAPPVIVPITTVSSPVASDGVTAQPVNSSPTVANDDELIEKEWVDKAKKVLAETKDDPYRREQEVGRLQADYLEKRYGRKLGSQQ